MQRNCNGVARSLLAILPQPPRDQPCNATSTSIKVNPHTERSAAGFRFRNPCSLLEPGSVQPIRTRPPRHSGFRDSADPTELTKRRASSQSSSRTTHSSGMNGIAHIAWETASLRTSQAMPAASRILWAKPTCALSGEEKTCFIAKVTIHLNGHPGQGNSALSGLSDTPQNRVLARASPGHSGAATRQRQNPYAKPARKTGKTHPSTPSARSGRMGLQ